MKTLILDWDSWDLVLDTSGNLGTIDSDVSQEEKLKYVAQTCANAIRQFKNDAYFFKDEGIPHFEEILGFEPPQSLVEEHIKNVCLRVRFVSRVEVIDYEWNDRTISGIVKLYTDDGGQTDVEF